MNKNLNGVRLNAENSTGLGRKDQGENRRRHVRISSSFSGPWIWNLKSGKRRKREFELMMKNSESKCAYLARGWLFAWCEVEWRNTWRAEERRRSRDSRREILPENVRFSWENAMPGWLGVWTEQKTRREQRGWNNVQVQNAALAR